MTAPEWWTDAAVKTIYGIRLTGTGDGMMSLRRIEVAA